MTLWQRWVRAPQTLLPRRALFQLHLWSGLGLGLYVLVIGLSGSALLLKSPFYAWFEPKYVDPAPDAVALQGSELQERMREVYAGYNVGFTFPSTERTRATYVVIDRGGEYFPHYFDQYDGVDLGPSNPPPIKAIEWLADLHDDLTLGRLGRQLNGWGALLFVLMSLSGVLLWWQGRARWHEGLWIHRKNSHSLWWQVHAFVGFWCLLLMLAWGISGLQITYPRTLAPLVRWLEGGATGADQASILRLFRAMHFASLGEGAVARWVWIVLSFVPLVLLVSGTVVWWRRVVRRRLLQKRPALESSAAHTSQVLSAQDSQA